LSASDNKLVLSTQERKVIDFSSDAVAAWRLLHFKATVVSNSTVKRFFAYSFKKSASS